MQDKKKILVLGQSFSTNLGDQAIYLALRTMLSRNGDCEIEGFPIKSVKLADFGTAYSVFKALYYAYALFVNIPAHYFRLAKKLSKCDLMFIGGGNLLMDHTLLSPLQFLLTCMLGRLSRIKIYVGAIGAGPIKSKLSGILFRLALNMVHGVSVRDEYSRNVIMGDAGIGFQRIPVHLTADPAFTFGRTCEDRHQAPPTVGISTFAFESPRRYGGSSEKHTKYIADVTALIESILGFGVQRIILIPTESPADTETMEAIAAGVTQKDRLTLTYPTTAQELIDTLCECDSLVGTRMHSIILALTQHVPVIGLAWHGKMDDLFDRLGRRGYLFDIENFDSRSVLRCITESLNETETEQRSIRNRLEMLANTAEQTTLAVRAMLNLR